jgi:hypothetical protein
LSGIPRDCAMPSFNPYLKFADDIASLGKWNPLHRRQSDWLGFAPNTQEPTSALQYISWIR